MKKLFFLMLMVLISMSFTHAQIAGSLHDMTAVSGETATCIFCHTPHTTDGADLLWNKGLATGLSFNSVAYATQGTAGAGTTACMTCHDGATSVGVIMNDVGTGFTAGTGNDIAITGGGNVEATTGIITGDMTGMGTDLAGDHPVGIPYADDNASGLNSGASVIAAGLRLTGTQVECNSCHDPHNTTNDTFLRLDNSASALCLTCHAK